MTREFAATLVVQVTTADVEEGVTAVDEMTSVVEGALIATVAEPYFDESAALVARTVTVWEDVTEEGAVYRPVEDIVPTAGEIDHVTALFVEPDTLALNCCDAPAFTVAVEGVSVTLIAKGAATEMGNVLVTEFAVADNCTVVAAEAPEIWAANCALVAPAATVTLEGIETDAPLDVQPKATGMPPEGAAPDSVTVHCAEAGEVIEAGLHVSPLSEGAAVVMFTVPLVAETGTASPFVDTPLTLDT